ncbi:biotin/methionine sulfoxide reductase [Brevibacterium sanguinis]|uniref:Biotin/methionine sulfoxide reductase n=2 Tax=Brevibacterium TaxID=1696 RepID=A0A366INC6_9MICO|nr:MULTISPECIES: molybdopterin-dependent oxidoreductase [Brevibacterium]RBP68000.1 biotin/methionine sulfoxide reductase [Brevibacterium sanguinis]RBP74583.1 biotin/methionine sulfoxide reductase [Brevibacterium celere]
MTTVPHSSHWGAFDVEVSGDRIARLIPAASDSDPNPLIHDLGEAVESPVRVRRPAVRRSWLEAVRSSTGTGVTPDGSRNGAPLDARRREDRGREPFVEVDWDEALDLVAGELARVRDRHGNAAIFGGSYGWSSAGRFHHARTQLHRFLNAFGGHTSQVGNYSYGAAAFVLPHVLGSADFANGRLTSWDVIAEHTELWVMFGGLAMKNTRIESGGISDHTIGGWLRRIRANGCEVVSISPIRDDAPDVVDPSWLPVRPTTDTALMLGLAHTLLVEGLHDATFLATHCVGWERMADHLLAAPAKDAEWASAITGIPAESIRDLARRMARHRTMISVTWSLQRADHGEQPYWAAILLAAMLGQIGLPGGGFGFGYGATGTMGSWKYPFPAPRLPTGPNPVTAPIPAARIADMLLDPGGEYDFNGSRCRYPDTRVVYWAGGNPFHHHQDLNRLRRGWAGPEAIVVHEPFWTATARHADIVLPATTTLERNDIGAASGDPRIIAMHQAISPRHGARSDYDIFSDLAARLGIAEEYTQGRSEMEWIEHLYATTRSAAAEHGIALPDFARFWSDGGVDIDPGSTVLLEDFRADPEAHPLATPSGRIELFSETVASFGYDDCPGHPVWIEPAEWLGAAAATPGSLHLVSNQPGQRLHSQLDMAGTSRTSKVSGREPCRLNPADAAERGIADGQIVRVFNERGSCLAGVRLSEDISRGVIQLSAGAWYQSDGGAAGALEIHGNPNVLTRDRGTSRLTQGPAALTALVEVEPYDAEAPAVTVTDSPPPLVAD